MRVLDPGRPGRLRGETIFLSGSVPDREGFERVPDATFLIEQAVVSLARAIFAEDGRIVFGAHPSISPLVAAVASEYKIAGDPTVPRRVVIYQSHAFDEALPDETWDMYRFGFADLVWTEARAGERFHKGEPASRKCPHSLTYMRQQMIAGTTPRVMVVVGGMEGVLEEVDLFAQFWNQDRPRPRPPLIYTAGKTGGAAARLVSQQRGGPLLRVLELEWTRAGGALTASADVADPRYRPLPPYGAMMQWLAWEIAGGSPRAL